MDPAALARACRRQGSPDAIVVATAGTPMTGAVDDVPALREAARLAGGVHLHVDGTRGGIVAAAAPDPPPFGFPAGADSVSLGGRAVLGMPDLWGAVLLGEVTPSPWEPSACVPLDADGGAAAAVRLWGVLCALGVDGLLRRVAGLLETASYAERRLADAGCRPCRHPASVAVSFARPPGWVCRKWGLDVEGERARIVAARGLTADAVDELADDLLRSVPVGPAD
jgi:histidine decarboxylase